MPVELSELRPNDYDEIIVLWKRTDNRTLDDDTLASLHSGSHPFNSVLSLVAREQGEMIGAILCEMRGSEGCLHHMAIRQTHLDTGLSKLLVDKALLKLNARGIHRCRIRLAQGTQPKPFWDATRWVDFHDTSEEQAPAPAQLATALADDPSATDPSP